MIFFDLKNKQPLIDLNGQDAKFVNNFSNSGFTQEVNREIEKLVKQLELRNFDVLGVKVDFTMTEGNIIEVFRIDIDELDFRLTSDWEIKIPQLKVSMHKDNSGSLEKYVGADWALDRKEFLDGFGYHHKMDNKKRILLRYNLRGSRFSMEYDYRDYGPEQNDPLEFSVGDVCRDLIIHLQKVTEHVMTFEVPALQNVFTEPEPIYLTNSVLKQYALFAYSNNYDMDENNKGIKPSRRLLSLGNQLPKDHPYYSLVNDGFTYMEMVKEINGKITPPVRPQDTQQFVYNTDSLYIHSVIPKNYNSFYVVDSSVFQTLKDAWFKENPNENELTDALVNEFLRKQAETIVPINEYQDNFVRPIVITNRTLWSDEIKVAGRYFNRYKTLK